MRNIDKLLISLVIFISLFVFQVNGEEDIFFTAKLASFVLAVGILSGWCIKQKNKWLGYLIWLYSLSFFKTILFKNAPKIFIFENMIVGMSIFLLYYLIRHFNFKENILKFLLIPACINIFIALIQAFDHAYLLSVNGITGLIGHPGFISIYLSLTFPIFLRYFKWGIPFVLLSILMANGAVGLIACLTSGLFYIYYTKKKLFRTALLTSIFLILICINFNKQLRLTYEGELRQRLSMAAGSINGMFHNPVLGWGIGSFIPTIAQVPMEKSYYFGIPFNTQNSIMNHPHNEFLMSGWIAGIGSIVLIACYFVSLFRRFVKDNLLSATIIVSGIICMMFYFLTFPAWFLFIIALGIYENENEKEVKNAYNTA